MGVRQQLTWSFDPMLSGRANNDKSNPLAGIKDDLNYWGMGVGMVELFGAQKTSLFMNPSMASSGRPLIDSRDAA